jgi:hypothetical protein
MAAANITCLNLSSRTGSTSSNVGANGSVNFALESVGTFLADSKQFPVLDEVLHFFNGECLRFDDGMN